MRQRDPVYQRKKELRLARAAGADDHRVKAKAAEVFCTDDDVLQLAVRFGAHRDLRPPLVAPAAPLRPQSVDIQLTGVADSQRPEQLGRSTRRVGDLAAA